MKVLILTEHDESISKRLWEFSVPMLRQKGVDARMATVRQGAALLSYFQESGIPTYAFDSLKTRDYLGVSRKLANLARKECFDVIHACESIPAFIASVSRFFGNPSKIIFNRQHNILHGKQRFLSFCGSNLAHIIMPVSKSSGESAVEYDHVSPEKICVAYSGVEGLRQVSKAEIVSIKDSLQIPENAAVISIVAHLRAEKGHDALLNACSKIVEAGLNRPLHLIIVGGGAMESALKRDAAMRTSFVTHFVGIQEDVALWFTSGDVVVMPSYHEAFGLTAVEAMSCSKPIVASGVGGLAEIFEHRVNGLLVPPGDPYKLAEAITEVLTDMDLALELGKNARQSYLEKFTMERMVDSWIDCYSSTIGKSKQNETPESQYSA